MYDYYICLFISTHAVLTEIHHVLEHTYPALLNQLPIYQHLEDFNIFTFTKILLNLLGWHGVINLHRFQVQNSIIRHLYIVLWFTTPIKSPSITTSPPYPLLPPPTPLPLLITIPLSVSIRCFFLLHPFTFLTQLPNPPPLWQLSVCSLYLWVYFYFDCYSLLCSLDSTYEWNHTVFVFLWLAYFT